MSHYEKGDAPVEFASTVDSATTKFLSQHKYYIRTLQAMEILLLKALCKEDFGHEL